MKIQKGKIGKPKKMRSTKSNASLKEVSVDDVIRQLLDLFDHLGVDSDKLAARVTGLQSSRIISKRTYPHVAAIGELLTSWHQDIEYLDNLGNPLPIRMRGKLRSFTALARKSVPNIEPKQLLTELEQVNAVSVDRRGLISVQLRSLPVYEDRRLAIQHTLTALDSFVKTLRHNLNSARSNSDQLFHRIARNGNYHHSEIPALKIRVRRQGQSFLESFDNWMTRRAKKSDVDSRRKRTQVAVGVYLTVDGRLV